MSGLSPSCQTKFSYRQLVWMAVLGDAIPVREWKRVHSPETVAQVDQFLISVIPMVMAVSEGGDDDFSDEQDKVWNAIKADGSGKFADAVREAIVATGAPATPGVDNTRCTVDMAQYACFCNSLAQSNDINNIATALSIAKQQGQWYYGCSDAVLQDPLYTGWLDVVKDTSTGSDPGTGGDPGGGAGGGATPTGAKEDDAKSNKNLYIGLGIGAAALVAGAATWFFWPKKAGKARTL